MNSSTRSQPTWGVGLSHYCFVPQRYLLGVLSAMGMCIQLLIRYCTPLTIKRMVKAKIISETEQRAQCPRGPGEGSVSFMYGQYEWSEQLQRIALISFYAGYILMHVPLGVTADRYGFKWPFAGSVFTSAIVVGATPIVVEKGEYWGILGMNILLGITQGGTNPALATLIAQWYPINERSRFGSIIYGGTVLGILIAYCLGNWVLVNRHWSHIYYIAAATAFTWCLIFVVFCYSTPNDHPFITSDEKDYLRSHLRNLNDRSEMPGTPWRAILTSLPVWAFIVIHIGHDWVLYSMYLDMPVYVREVLRFSHYYTLALSCVGFFMYFAAIVSWGFFSDYLLIRNLMTFSDLRKMNTLISGFGPGLLLLFSSYARCHYVLVIVFFGLCMCMMGPFYSGAKMNSIDLSPNYAGTLMGLSNGLGSLGAIAPNILNVITTKTTLSEWRNIFWLDFIVITSGAVVYTIFGTSKVQRWNTMED